MTTAPLTLSLFGPLRILVNGEPMPRVRSRAAEWLLALLVLRQGRAVSRSWLAGTLWPQSEETQALQNLRHALLSLRKALGREAARIQSPTRDTLTLDLEGADVDVLRFDAAVEAGDEDSLANAVATYAGPLLEGCYEAWVALERESREQSYLAALEMLADRAAERGDPAAAVRHLRKAETLDPLRDTTVQRLMAVLEATGDPAAALEVYHRLRLRLHNEVSAAPDEATTHLFREIRARSRARAEQKTEKSSTSGTPELTVPKQPPPLPVSTGARPPYPVTRMIGREQEVAAVRQRLTQSRLVTLVGAGGIGKTRLALEVAALVLAEEEAFEGGVAWVELASLADGALVLLTIAAALGIGQEGASDAPTLYAQNLENQVVSRLSGSPILLALDNCEHLLDATAEVVQRLLSRCPGLRVLATSRQRFGVTGEITWRVPSLPSPDPDDLSHVTQNVAERMIAAVLAFPAAQLFVERAAMARSDFLIANHEEAIAVARICRHLDGIPLAIELAAARVSAMSVGQIASRLGDRFQLLTGGSRGVLTRQRTLRALIDWSYNLLTPEEQALLCYLSVFAGGWTLEAAEAVASDKDEESRHFHPSDLLDVLVSLVDKSLVLSEAGGANNRYQMLETVREYAAEKLRERGEEQAARTRHADYYLDLAEQARPFLAKPEPAWLDRLETEHDNFRAARSFFAAQDEQGEQGEQVENAVRLVAALAPFLSVRGHYYEQRTWLLDLATRPTAPTRARAELLGCAAGLFNHDEEFARAKQMLTERLQIVRPLGDRREIVRALNALSGLISHPRIPRSEYDAVAARALAEESLAIARDLGDRQEMAQVLYQLGDLARQSDDRNEARARWMECHALDQELGKKGGYVLWALGDLAWDSSDWSAALGYFGRFMAERYEVGDRWNAAWVLTVFCPAALSQGEAERAARLLGASVALCESSHPLTEHQRERYGALRNAVREVLGDSALGAAEAEGRALTLEQAMQLARSETSAYGKPPPSRGEGT
jgi:non-specific serine/threonine protein kinase